MLPDVPNCSLRSPAYGGRVDVILRQANLATGTYPPMAEDFTLKANNSSYFHES